MFVIQDMHHKTQLFVEGLRSDIFQLVLSANLKSFLEMVDRATLVERGAAITRVRREASDRGKEKKRSHHSSGGD